MQQRYCTETRSIIKICSQNGVLNDLIYLFVYLQWITFVAYENDAISVATSKPDTVRYSTCYTWMVDLLFSETLYPNKITKLNFGRKLLAATVVVNSNHVVLLFLITFSMKQYKTRMIPIIRKWMLVQFHIFINSTKEA